MSEQPFLSTVTADPTVAAVLAGAPALGWDDGEEHLGAAAAFGFGAGLPDAPGTAQQETTEQEQDEGERHAGNRGTGTV